MTKWADRWAVVTGSSSGIGAEFARQLAARGMHVVLTARREDRLQELAEELARLHGAKAVVIPGDLSDEQMPKRIFETVKEKNLDVALLVNNAGFGQVTSIDDHDTERDLAVVDVNIRALTELTYLFLKPMCERGEGSILNVASAVSFQPVAYMPVYSASKAFVLHFTEALWAELKGSGVRVAALCPGTTETEFFDEAGVPGWLAKQASQPASRVVRTGLKAVERGKPFVVSGWRNWLLTSLQRFFPRKLVVLETRKYFRPKNR